MLSSLILLTLLGLTVSLYRRGWLVPTPKGIRVLMYHKISDNDTDFLTVTVAQLQQHIEYIRAEKYEIISLKQVLDYWQKGGALPPKAVVFTFDDGYANNLSLGYPVFQQYAVPVTIFLPTAYIGTVSGWDVVSDTLMSIEALKSMDPNLVSFGLHSHKHLNYKHLEAEQIREDLGNCLDFFRKNQLAFLPVLAYAYGGRPKNKRKSEEMKGIFESLGIKFAFRIGNRVAALKPTDRYEIKRIDIRGTDSLEDFKNKIRVGRVTQF